MILPFIAGINWGRVAATLAIVGAISAGVWKIHHTGVTSGRNEIQSQWDSAKLKQANKDLEAEKKEGERAKEARKRELELQTEADTLRRIKDAQIKEISRQRDRALADNRLLRTPRPAEYTPTPPGTGPVCSGAGLFTEDADFLIRESARASRLRAAYLNCETQYNKARDAVNKLLNQTN